MIAVLVMGIFAVAGWGWFMARQAKEAQQDRIDDLKSYLETSKEDMKAVMAVNAEVEKSITRNSDAILTVHAKVDGVSQKIDLLSARLENRG